MKSFLLSVSAAFAGEVAKSQLANTIADFDCNFECYKGILKDIRKCNSDEEATQEDKTECETQAWLDFWFSCLGEQCGATLPEGVCAERCIPPLEEAVEKCDEMLENGEISNIEHYMCIMGPGGPGETWEICTAECICEQPFCNCEPPETAQVTTGYIKRWDLRDISIICYK